VMFCALSCQTYFDYEVRDDIRLKFHPLMLQGWGGGREGDLIASLRNVN